MEWKQHLRITAGALKAWFVAQAQDALAVGILWLAGLLVLGVPWAPFWAVLAALLQFIPNLGTVLGMLGPALAAAIRWGDWQHPLYVVILYAVIVVTDGLVLQPYLMRRAAKVPIWASVLVPLVLAFVAPLWGVLLAPPVLAVIYAYRAQMQKRSQAGGRSA